MLRFITLIAATLAFGSSARAQHAHDQAAAHFCWYNVPTDVRAITAANIVTLSTDPLGTCLVSLATGIPIDPNSVSNATPLVCNPAQPGIGQGMGGGTIPQNFFKPQPAGAAGGGGSSNAGGGGGSSSGSTSGSGAAAQPMIDQGFWEVDGGSTSPIVPSSVPVSTKPFVDTPEPGTLVLGGIGLICLAARRLRARSVTSTPPPSESV